MSARECATRTKSPPEEIPFHGGTILIGRLQILDDAPDGTNPTLDFAIASRAMRGHLMENPLYPFCIATGKFRF